MFLLTVLYRDQAKQMSAKTRVSQAETWKYNWKNHCDTHICKPVWMTAQLTQWSCVRSTPVHKELKTLTITHMTSIEMLRLSA